MGVDLYRYTRNPIYIAVTFILLGCLGCTSTSLLWRSPFTFELCSPKSLPTKFEFVINLKTAKQIGVTIAPEVLGRASRLIK